MFSTFCESHASDISFHVVARLLRAIAGISDLDDAAARARLRSRFPDGVDPQDLVLLDDLLGIRDPDTELPPIDPAARGRRLTALINAVSLARTEPMIYILEDAHWIDAVSESMLAEFVKVIPQTPSMALITYRPYYHGALAQVPGAQTVALAPLGDADISALIGELVGPDPSVGAVAALITERTAGNPFFAEEMVRELAERGVLEGERGHYRVPHRCGRGQRAGHRAGGHRRAHRSPRTGGQTDAKRRGGDRIAVRPGSVDQPGDRSGPRGAGRGGDD